MKTRIQKWGNSLALRIPKPLADEAGLDENAEVELTMRDGQLIVQPAAHFTLEALLAQITPENLHDEIDSGSPLGNEAW